MVLTTGVTDGPLVARQEIRVFAQDQDLMNLFLLGVRSLQAVDESETTSWFQIAGIHGRYLFLSAILPVSHLNQVLMSIMMEPRLRHSLTVPMDIAFTLHSSSQPGQSY